MNTIKITNQEEPRAMNQNEQRKTMSQEPKEDEHDQDHNSRELGLKNQRRTNTIKITN
jgi:hypothetical protein